ncbi:phage holin family protein [Tsuneonella sp. HG249]
MNEDNAGTDMPVDDEPSAGIAAPADDSLIDDVRNLVDDGKTYLEAELQYQKSRAALVADRGRSGAIYGAIALALVHLALVALVVGLVIALTPLITAWGATAAVVGVLTVVAGIFAVKAKGKFASISGALNGTGE